MNEILGVGSILPLLVTLVIGAGLMYVYLKSTTPTSDPDACDKDFSKSKRKLIPFDQAKIMYDNYTEHRSDIITNYEQTRSRSNFSPTRYGTYKFETIANYFDFLDCLDKQLRANTDYPNGIVEVRYYFAKYPNKSKYEQGSIADKIVGEVAIEWGFKALDYQGRNTFFIVPVVESKDKEIRVPFLYKESGNSVKVLELENFGPDQSQQLKSILNEPLFEGDPTNPEDYKPTILNEAGLTPPPF